MRFRFFGNVLLLSICAHSVVAQSGLKRFDGFEIKQEDVVWQHVFKCGGSADSVRSAVVQMLKSKFYTFNVIRNEEGYNGELKHYRVDCEKYDRSYVNTPRMYWDGEWSGKFIAEIEENAYRVTVYALYYDKMEQAIGYYKTEKPVRGRYFDAVTVKKKNSFRKKELSNLSLMSLSLKDEFDVRNTVPVKR